MILGKLISFLPIVTKHVRISSNVDLKIFLFIRALLSKLVARDTFSFISLILARGSKARDKFLFLFMILARGSTARDKFSLLFMILARGSTARDKFSFYFMILARGTTARD